MMPPTKPLKKPEFVALMAMAFATIAFSIDAILPAMDKIGAQLTPDDLNRAQLILISFVLGMGLATFFTGPLSDALGRRRVLLGGFIIYIIGAVLGMLAGSLELILAARLIQGMGAAGPRVVAMAIIRDSYSGRQMAQLTSFVMVVFMLVPAIAPSMGAAIIAFVGWRAVFGAFALFAMIISLWFGLRQPETLPTDARRPFRAKTLWSGVKEVFANPVVRITLMVQTLLLGVLYALLSSAQQLFDITFDQGANFPLWFGGVAVVSAFSSILNAKLVIKYGMQRLIRAALSIEIIISGLFALIIWQNLLPDWAYFPAFLIFMTSVFFMVGLTLGNLNAIAMEPMGHMAGMAASAISATATVLGIGIAAPIGLAFDGTPLPLTSSVFVLIVTAFGLMQLIKKEPVYVHGSSNK